MNEHQIVVVFDVTATDREAAARYLASALQVARAIREHPIESWWFPEPALKHIDGNDNPGFTLVRTLDSGAEGCLTPPVCKTASEPNELCPVCEERFDAWRVLT